MQSKRKRIQDGSCVFVRGLEGHNAACARACGIKTNICAVLLWRDAKSKPYPTISTHTHKHPSPAVVHQVGEHNPVDAGEEKDRGQVTSHETPGSNDGG
jgi:hypothetical protein